MTLFGKLSQPFCHSFFSQERQKCGATMLAAWEHSDIAGIIAALKPPNAKQYSVWPTVCDSETWKEPSYIDPSDSCYDQMLRYGLSTQIYLLLTRVAP